MKILRNFYNFTMIAHTISGSRLIECNVIRFIAEHCSELCICVGRRVSEGVAHVPILNSWGILPERLLCIKDWARTT